MKTKSYIVEIGKVLRDDTTIYLEDNGEPVDSLYAAISIADRGACVVDTCYRSIAEAQNGLAGRCPAHAVPSHP